MLEAPMALWGDRFVHEGVWKVDVVAETPLQSQRLRVEVLEQLEEPAVTTTLTALGYVAV